MSRANDGGWDFVEVGKTYQYKEDWFIAMVTILEDNSDDEYYSFRIRVEKSTTTPPDVVFDVSHKKELPGIWSGMLQFYEHEAYMCNYKWSREELEANDD